MDFCYKTATVWQLIGQFIFVLKILIPLALIILSTIDLGKSAISGDEKALSKSISTLIKRFVLGVCIFFIPLIIKVLFTMVSGFSNDMQQDAGNCINCLTSPYNNCDTSYQGELFRK